MIPIYYPKSYLKATDKQLNKICNGCGAKDGIKVPDSMWGLCIVKACEIHDWMYERGLTQGDLDFANAMFDYNLRAIIKNESNVFTRYWRLNRADKYAFMVEKFGDKAYWVNKEKNKDMTITYQGVFK